MGNNYSTISFVLNFIIFVVTATLVIRFFREDGDWSLDRARHAFRYFTVQSNVLCAIAALLRILFPDSGWTYYLKFAGTAAVMVTMMTVLLFLGPTFGYINMFIGSDLFMHLLTPLTALVSLCVFERRGISLPCSFVGLLPVVLYAPLYGYKVLYAPKDRRWDDFYGFNRDGKWPLKVVFMLLLTVLICVALYFLLNI
jgi:hypothetical protein